MESIRFKEGDIVYEITRPKQLMRITKCSGGLIYCRLVNHKRGLELAYQPRDIKAAPAM